MSEKSLFERIAQLSANDAKAIQELFHEVERDILHRKYSSQGARKLAAHGVLQNTLSGFDDRIYAHEVIASIEDTCRCEYIRKLRLSKLKKDFGRPYQSNPYITFEANQKRAQAKKNHFERELKAIEVNQWCHVCQPDLANEHSNYADRLNDEAKEQALHAPSDAQLEVESRQRDEGKRKL